MQARIDEAGGGGRVTSHAVAAFDQEDRGLDGGPLIGLFAVVSDEPVDSFLTALENRGTFARSETPGGAADFGPLHFFKASILEGDELCDLGGGSIRELLQADGFASTAFAGHPLGVFCAAFPGVIAAPLGIKASLFEPGVASGLFSFFAGAEFLGPGAVGDIEARGIKRRVAAAAELVDESVGVAFESPLDLHS